MRNKGVFLAAILTAVLCISGNVFAEITGDGRAVSPFQIWLPEDFNNVFANPANAATYWANGKYTELMCNVNLSGTTYTGAVIAPDINSSAAGHQGPQFGGNFNGTGHIISNLTINASNYVGLFGDVNSNGHIRNLGVKNVHITGVAFVGGLVGNNQGTLTDCNATGDVNGMSHAGGLVGFSDGTLTDCNATSDVNGQYYVGGLVGNGSCTLIDCNATGSVRGIGYVGGLVGQHGYGTLTACYATGSVSGTNYVGGLVGSSVSTITSCYATGTVDGNGAVGGLVGENSRSITDCYATGNVTGGSGGACGGLAGNNLSGLGTLTHCYASGSVTSDGNMVGGLVGCNLYGPGMLTLTHCYASGSVSGTGSYVGGLVGAIGVIPPQIIACFWNITKNPTIKGVGNLDPVNGVISKTTILMTTKATFTNYGWDFNSPNTDSDPSEWWMPNYDPPILNYPLLAWQRPYEEGQGTEADPYQIKTPQQMNAIGANSWDWGMHFRLIADINMSAYTGTQYKIIGNNTRVFNGTFDGWGHVISNLNYTTTAAVDYVGLFGYILNATIQNLGVKKVNILCTSGDMVGGLVGQNVEGTVTSCYATGSVSGRYSVGGLVGLSSNSTLTSCYASGTVSGTNKAGGLVGESSGTVTLNRCYAATGPIPAGNGGLVGWKFAGTLIPTACFWDTGTSGTNDGVGNVDPDPDEVKPAGTTDMKRRSTFTNAGWNFDTDYWRMCNDNEDYPRLAWEASNTLPGDLVCPTGVVNELDLMHFGELWMEHCVNYDACKVGNINGDDRIDNKDYAIMAAHWREEITP